MSRVMTNDELIAEIKETKKELWAKIQEYSKFVDDKDEFQLMNELITASPLYQGATTSLLFYQDRLQVVNTLIEASQPVQINVNVKNDENFSHQLAEDDVAIDEVPTIASEDEIMVNDVEDEEDKEPVGLETITIDLSSPVIERITELEQDAIHQEQTEDAEVKEIAQTNKGVNESVEVHAEVIEDEAYEQNMDAFNLMPAELEAQIIGLYSTENQALMEQTVYAHYFMANWDWFLLEYDVNTKTAFGLVNGHEPELTYFSIAELQEFNQDRQDVEFRVERDLYLDEKITLGEAIASRPYVAQSLQRNTYLWNKYEEFMRNADIQAQNELIGSADIVNEDESTEALTENAILRNLVVGDIVLDDGEKFRITSIPDFSNGDVSYLVMEGIDDLSVTRSVLVTPRYLDDWTVERIVEAERNKQIAEEEQEISETTQTNEVTVEIIEDSQTNTTGNEVISVEGQAGGGEKTHARKNIEALKVLQKHRGGQELTEEDKNTIAQFSGWGSCAQVFSNDESWENLHNELENLQSEDEQLESVKTTLTSFYTPEELGQSIWEHLENVGFEGGKVLEPALGMGNLIRVMPNDLKEKSKIDGIEIDPQVSEMAQVLMNDVNVVNSDFGECSFENGSYDAVVSNVPFGNISIDGEGGHGSMMIHDYYFVRAMDALKEGGVCAFITSTGTLDKLNSNIRQILAEDNQFCGAVRLPNGFFKNQANTQVATDVIFLRKGFDNEVDKQANRELWCSIEKFENTEQTLNKWFVENPQYVLGDVRVGSNQFGETLKFENDNLKKEEIDKALNSLNERFGNFYNQNLSEVNTNLKTIKNGGFNNLSDLNSIDLDNIPKAQKQKFEDVNHILMTAKELLMYETDNEDEDKIEEKRKELNSVYDVYVEKNGYLSLSKNKKICDLTKQTPFLMSLENSVDGDNKKFTKADLFNHRVIYQKQEIQINNFQDALVFSLVHRGKIDVPYMLNSFDEGKNSNVDDLYRELKGQIFWDIDKNEFVTRNEFSSGNVRKKLKAYQDKNFELTEDINKSDEVILQDIYSAINNSVDYVKSSPMSNAEKKMLAIFKEQYIDLNKTDRRNLYGYSLRRFYRDLCLIPDYQKALEDFKNDGSRYSLEYINEFKTFSNDSRLVRHFLTLEPNMSQIQKLDSDISITTHDTFQESGFSLPENALFSEYPLLDRDSKIASTWGSDNESKMIELVCALAVPDKWDDERFVNIDNYNDDNKWHIEYRRFIPCDQKDQIKLDAFRNYLYSNCDDDYIREFKDVLNRELPNELALSEYPSFDDRDKKKEEIKNVGFKNCIEFLRPKYEEFERYCEKELEKQQKENKIEDLALKEYVADGLDLLEKIQPENLTKDDISVSLSSYWLPVEVFENFASQEMNLSAECQYIDCKSEWNVKQGWNYGFYKGSPDYSTDDITALKMLRSSMNSKAVRVMKTVYDNEGNERKVEDEDKTMLAQEKQLLMEDRFKTWVWENEDREREIVKLYNEKFNCFKDQEFDGSQLVFQGMSDKYNLYKHQKDAVARTLYSQTGSLFAHVVGAGKTLEFVTSVMERKRLGLCNKPLIVVPKHIIGQTATEFFKAYPNANLLVADDKDFSKNKRKEFISRIATGNWDAVILSHEQLQKISFSYDYMKKMLENRVHEFTVAYEQAFRVSHDGKDPTVKALRQQKNRYEEKVKKLLNGRDKDIDSVPFESLGVDMLVVDEAHAFKNLAFMTGLSNVKGVNTSASQRSEDMLLKTDFIRDKFGSKSLLFATGTPISNSMAELYTMTRYLSPELLDDLGLTSFDKWAGVFANVETKWEILPEGGGLKQNRRFSSFKNLPELMSLVNEFADIKTQEDLEEVDVPTVDEITVSVKPTEQQKKLIDYVYKRARNLRENVIDPSEDNFLNITNDARRLSLDARLLFVGEDYDVRDEEMFPRPEGGKINACADNVLSEYEASNKIKGTQLVFCDTSTPASGKWNVYEELKRCLIERGIPENEIVFVHDAKNDNERMKLFDKVQAGQIRVLLGSTSKLGTGTNVQNLLVASHDLDCPWKPSDLEQRKGRVVRNGNQNENVKVYRYVTEGTFDSYLYSLVSNKQHFISQILNRKGNERIVDDLGTEIELSFNEIASVAMGDNRLKERMELETDIRRLKISRSNFTRQQLNNEKLIHVTLPRDIEKLKNQQASFKSNKELLEHHINNNDKEKWCGIEIDGVVFNENQKVEACKELYNKAIKGQYAFEQGSILGHYKGFDIVLSRENFNNINAPIVSLKNPDNNLQMICKSCLKPDSSSNVQLLDNVLSRIDDELLKNNSLIDSKEMQLKNLKTHENDVWDHLAELQEKEQRFNQLEKELKTVEDDLANRNVDDITLDSILEAQNVEVINNGFDDEIEQTNTNLVADDKPKIKPPNELRSYATQKAAELNSGKEKPAQAKSQGLK